MRSLSLLSIAVAFFLPAALVTAQEGKVMLTSKAPFATVAEALEKAVGDAKMALVCHANAQRGAAARGVKIAGNQVFMLFRNDYAVRIVNAVPEAGIEAPLRIYLHENRDRDADLRKALRGVQGLSAPGSRQGGRRARSDF
ncbi:MAG: hypothetical protein HY725_14770 [Candidatus Rokubacteria bacterium]|nr:hypothetical protein [Candidatus Rokubacteria bacterium]